MVVEEEEFVEMQPRNYQEKLIAIAINQNSIIFLPTGSGKTFIAVCVLRELAKQHLHRSYDDGGKITIFLANTVALVNQHGKYLKINSPFSIGIYTGDLNVDLWNPDQWNHEFNTHKVLVMTSQIMANLLSTNIININKVNLIIFDECHQGVDDHSMRQVMKHFQNANEQPRVLGLTATLLNGNVKSSQVLDEVRTLETTYHAKVATVDELINVIGFSTNPKEVVSLYSKAMLTPTQTKCVTKLNKISDILRTLKIESNLPVNPSRQTHLRQLEIQKPHQKWYKLIDDAVYHIEMFGSYGGCIAVICYIFHLECEKRLCVETNSMLVLNSIICTFTYIKGLLDQEMAGTTNELERVYKFSTNKVIKLITLLQGYKDVSTQDLCGIIFVHRRNTAKFIYHILVNVAKLVDNLTHMKPDFMIGITANPLNNNRESIYYAKMNKMVVDMFNKGEVNLLIASNVIEEGIDVPRCSLVIKFDTPTNYREYIQSKGRARHSTSLYYIMVENSLFNKFNEKYQQYQQTETDLNNYLIGKNTQRSAPSQKNILEMYNEMQPPYYVDGPGSAQINMLNAIPLLMMYCGSLTSDAYTNYEPNWLLDYKNILCEYKVIIEMPIVCPILDPISGNWFVNKKDAKRSAAFNACKLLHQCGALNQHLVPVKKELDTTENDFLFTHWPAVQEKNAGVTNKRRVYTKAVPKVISKPIDSKNPVYLHIIEITPKFQPDTIDLDQLMLFKLYNANLCFGLITNQKLPSLCDFPVYTSAGELTISLKRHKYAIELSESEILELSHFHHLIFAEVLDIIKSFLMLNNKESSLKHMLLVPVDKSGHCIDFKTVHENKVIKNKTRELKLEEKLNLVVDTESYLGKIVTPWYRAEDKQYVVIQVCDNDAESAFPSDLFSTYASYFHEKYNISTIKPKLPLLLVKALSSRLNCLKPRGISKKKRKDDTYDDLQLHLIPEMCVKQDFPSSLWVQASLLPTILHRIVQLLRAEQLRATIATEADLGVPQGCDWDPLEFDSYLQTYETNLNEMPSNEQTNEVLAICASPNAPTINMNHDFNKKMNDSQFPWSAEEEPKDINRDLNATVLDVEYFMKFIKEPLTSNNPTFNSPSKQKLAIKYDPSFAHKPILMLMTKVHAKGPEINAIYQALATAKASDIVNLERLETLGDSFLKMIASLYIFMKFPKYTEGQATTLKSKLVSNKNLFYLAKNKDLGSFIKHGDLQPRNEWLPIGYSVPKQVQAAIDRKITPIGGLFDINIPLNEVVSGRLSQETIAGFQKGRAIQSSELDEEEAATAADEDDNNSYTSLCTFLGLHMIPDKTIADVSEALIGAYFKSMGFEGAVRFVEWLQIIPPSENIMGLLRRPVASPIINPTLKNVDFFMPAWTAVEIETILGYKFNNRAYLLQAYTHSSYTQNRITYSYERLEYIGDAVLDFLITCHIYESCGKLDPGELTDLRSALVNNGTFASYVIRLGLHKYLMHYSSSLNKYIEKFAIFQESKGYEINDDILILLNEKDLKIGENIDVPKVLGDIFESLAGAIYLDSGMDLEVVWRVFYKIMHKEIHLYSQNVPKNPIRLFHDTMGAATREFGKPVVVPGGGIMVKLQFLLNGEMTVVFGFGDNSKSAKKAAAKLALQLLASKKNVETHT